jgi:hypothetical protein
MTKQIDIKELIPFMRKGYVTMDKSGEWVWWEKKPVKDKYADIWVKRKALVGAWVFLNSLFNIAPVSDWTKSLIKVENDNAR